MDRPDETDPLKRTDGSESDNGTATACELVMIAALAEVNRVIGSNGVIPWHLPEDLRRFRELTWGHPIIMGRKTWALGLKKRTLPQRLNIVVSRSLGNPLPIDASDRDDPVPVMPLEGGSLVMVRSLPDALTYVRGCQRVFIIGGASIYEQMLPFVHRLELTLVPGIFQGDAYFPEYEQALSEFECVARMVHPHCTYVTYRRRTSPPPFMPNASPRSATP